VGSVGKVMTNEAFEYDQVTINTGTTCRPVGKST
jgi:hypothetical protein